MGRTWLAAACVVAGAWAVAGAEDRSAPTKLRVVLEGDLAVPGARLDLVASTGGQSCPAGPPALLSAASVTELRSSEEWNRAARGSLDGAGLPRLSFAGPKPGPEVALVPPGWPEWTLHARRWAFNADVRTAFNGVLETLTVVPRDRQKLLPAVCRGPAGEVLPDVEVVDLRTWEHHRSSRERLFLLGGEGRRGGACLLAPACAPRFVDEATLRGPPLDATGRLVVEFAQGRSFRVRAAPPSALAAQPLPVETWVWSRDVLVTRARGTTDHPLALGPIGDERVEVVVQAQTLSGAWLLGRWNGLPGDEPVAIALAPSRYHYATPERCVAEPPGVARSGDDDQWRITRDGGTRRIACGWDIDCWTWAEPGTYDVSHPRSAGGVVEPFTCEVRDGVVVLLHEEARRE
jgi:hypothetical protein